MRAHRLPWLSCICSLGLACAPASDGSNSATPHPEAPTSSATAASSTQTEVAAATATPNGTAIPSNSAAAAAANPATPAATDPHAEWERWPKGRHLQPPREDDGDRIYSKVRHLWIRPTPHTKAWDGYLTLGESIRVKDGNAETAFETKGWGGACKKWYAVEPRGFVCVGDEATLDGNDPVVVELRKRRADRTSPWPFDYAESLETPVYHKPPEPKEQLRREGVLKKHMELIARARAKDPEALADKRMKGVDLTAAGKGPPELLPLPIGGKTVKRRVAFGSTLAYVDAFDLAERTFLMTWDRGIVPKDKVKPYPRSDFRGVILGSEGQLPIAFFRGKDRPKYQRNDDGSFSPLESQWTRLSWTELTGRSEVHDDKRYYETKAGPWCRRSDASIVEQAKKRPPQILAAKQGRRSWMDVSILRGTLVAYENETPVYATLISPGRGGMPHHGVPTIDTASTPTGGFYILGKFVTATMVSSSNANLVHSEVQYTQNITGPYALHGAYWHDRWGEPKSGGCVNLAPVDAKRLFAWTDPPMPSDWHGLRTIDFGEKTLVDIHR